MKNKAIQPFLLLALLGLGLFLGFGGFAKEQGDAQAQASRKPLSENDREISAHAQRMMDNGRRIFRFDTFGSEAFFGDALQLHKAIAGEKNGGVGGGVSPKTALSVGSMPWSA